MAKSQRPVVMDKLSSSEWNIHGDDEQAISSDCPSVDLFNQQ
jgi:hypothetical protein